MQRWWSAIRDAADQAGGRSGLWLPGALAWVITVGWLPLLLVVAEPPGVSDLTFFGARLYSSSAWPWNAVAMGVAALLGAVAVVSLVALAETILASIARRRPSGADVARAIVIGAVTAAPALLALLAGAIAFVLVAMSEFNAPGATDPLLRTLRAVIPFGAAVAVAWTLGAVAHAVALREVVRRDAGVLEAFGALPRQLRRVGGAMVLTAAVSLMVRAAALVLATVMLEVLWRPIAARLTGGGIDATVAPLLVGFVAIWLCLVLAGGALHAWESITWTRVLGDRLRAPEGVGAGIHGDPYRS